MNDPFVSTKQSPEDQERSEASEALHEMGKFVLWLVERLGYEVRLQVVRHPKSERPKGASPRQQSIEIVATKGRDDGTIGLYRFVLKQGRIDQNAWGDIQEPETLVHEIALAATVGLTRDQEDLQLSEPGLMHLSVVVVHQGEIDPAIIPHREALQSQLAEHRVELCWWGTQELTEKLISLRDVFATSGLLSEELFPPSVRPAVRLVIDALRRDITSFDLTTVDDYLDSRMPLGRELQREGAVDRLSPGQVIGGTELTRVVSELPVFAGLLLAECRKHPHPTVLPVLDSIERCVCRVAEMARRLPGDDEALPAIRQGLRKLMAQYVNIANDLRLRLDSLRELPQNLALASMSEMVDYPLRCTRILGYLAVAGHYLLEEGMRREAEFFALSMAHLWVNNDAGYEGPVTDDQIIELAGAWQLWLSLGAREQVATVTGNIVERMAMARTLGLALPALYQQAAVPISEQDARILARAHTFGPRKTTGFEDGGSTLLSFALYAARRFGQVDPETVKRLHQPSREPGSRPLEACYLQLWQPPEDAAEEWYAHEIEHRGICWVFEDVDDPTAFLAQFENHARPPQASFGQRIGLPVLDLVAWKRWRTLPDASRLVSLCQQLAATPP